MVVLVKVNRNFDLKIATSSRSQNNFLCYVRLQFMFS